MVQEIARTIVFILGYFIVTVSLVPLIRNDNWIFRIFEYPRAQKLFINIILLSVFVFIADWNSLHSVIFAALLGANALYLFYQIFPYTILSQRQLKDQKIPAEGRNFKLLICNVYQDNRNVQPCLDCIKDYDPDIVILVETDVWWKEKLASLEEKYPHRIMKPLENTYGMLLYSRLELIDPRVHYLIEEGIPSIHTKVKLPCGELFHLFSVHPQPPVPQENPRSTERDAELLLVAKKAKGCKKE